MFKIKDTKLVSYMLMMVVVFATEQQVSKNKDRINYMMVFIYTFIFIYIYLYIIFYIYTLYILLYT